MTIETEMERLTKMTFRQLISASFFHFAKLKDVKKTPFWKATLYFIALSILLAVPAVYQAMNILAEIQKDSAKIAEKIPTFTISEGEIQTDDGEGFIYQTNSIILTFDPEGKRSEKDIQNDLVGNYFSIGLLKNKAVIALPDYGGLSTSMFGDNVLSFSYKSQPFRSLTSEKLKELLSDLSTPFWVPLVMLLAGMYPSMINLAVTLLFTSFVGLTMAKLRLRKITFFEAFKTMIFCASLPTLLAMLINFFDASFDTSLLIATLSLFIFYQVSQHFAKIEFPGS